MQPLEYALVAYVRNSVGRFVEDLRREVYPEHAHLPAHITVLPPRRLQGTEAEGIRNLEEVCAGIEPFELTMDGVETFVPATPTVYIRVDHGSGRMQELHRRLNAGVFHCTEQWSYLAHLTIVKLESDALALHALEHSRRRWEGYRGTRRVLIDQLTFVREGPNNRWIDLAQLQLGRDIAPRPDK
ncbi:MAG: 2'-5' RNA ligase family protein [Terriglobales bacterium]